MEIRLAVVDDLAPIVEIRNYYVAHTQVTFDDKLETIDERRSWFEAFGRSGRYRLVVADDDEVCGWACSVRYRDHPAFLKTVEFNICLAPTHLRRGLGTLLYRRLLAELEAEDVHRAVAGIALPNEASVRLHLQMGFTEVGVFDEYAIKEGQFMSVLWMQRPL